MSDRNGEVGVGDQQPNLTPCFIVASGICFHLFQPAVQVDLVRSALRPARARPASCVTDLAESVCVRAEKMTANKVRRPRAE